VAAPPPEYLVALVTPFTQTGILDLKAHTFNMRALADRGIEGFVIGGSNGEGPYLEPGEREQLVKAGRRRKAHFMAGIAAETTRAALAQLGEVTDAGADSVLVLTPTTLARDREDAIVGFYREIADRSRIPVFLYSVPLVTGYSIPVDLVARLAAHRRIVGIKDSSGNVVRIQSIIDATPGAFLVYSGSSRAMTAAMMVGCHGAITGSGNYLPELVLDVMKAASSGDVTRSRRLQKKLSAISGEIEAYGVPGVKAAARAAGLRAGFPRAPLTRLSHGTETSIAKTVQSA
jgi:dihydrodipicolinate synthase/N-acetylneuraminate lyase